MALLILQVQLPTSTYWATSITARASLSLKPTQSEPIAALMPEMMVMVAGCTTLVTTTGMVLLGCSMKHRAISCQPLRDCNLPPQGSTTSTQRLSHFPSLQANCVSAWWAQSKVKTVVVPTTPQVFTHSSPWPSSICTMLTASK